MSVGAASLRGRIMLAFVLIVVLAVLLSVTVGYFVTRSQMNAFVAQLLTLEADDLVRALRREHGSAGGWATVDRALAQAGYLYPEGGEHDGRGERPERSSEMLFHVDRVRVVVVDDAGLIVRDNLSRLRPGTPAPELGGTVAAVIDPAAGRPVGSVHLDVERAFLAAETHGFLRATLVTTALGAALTAAAALLLAAWIAHRITTPVTRLTRAAAAIARRGGSALLPVTSADELGRMSAAFNRMTRALQTQRELRRRLIDDLSHELNTPLCVIRLEAQGLRDGLQAPAHAADRIIREVSLLHNLVSDLNWLAETDSGELRLTRESCSVDELVSAELRRWQPQAQMRRIDLSFQPWSAVPALDLDRTRMRQALGNVIRNALQHTATGGRIIVAAGVAAGQAAITVTDDGAGIDAADLPYLFDRLYRTDESRTRGTGGSGLGLAIARAIVTAHAGTIAVTSLGPGKGTTVRFSFPAAGAANRAGEADTPAPGPGPT